MSNIELLLGLDTETLTMIPEGEVEIPRLSKLAGQTFTVGIKAVSGRQIQRIKDLATDRKGKMSDYDVNLLTCMYGITDPDMNNDDLLHKFGVSTPKDLIDKMFLMGEVTTIAKEIIAISGLHTEDDDESFEDEVKN